MSSEHKPRSRLEIAGIAVLLAVLAVLLYRDVARRMEDNARRDQFVYIYERGWATYKGSQGKSGFGSTMEFTKLYRMYLQDFLATHGIRSVVDAGCGDWEFSRAMDWKGIDYLGVDIVPAAIEANRRQFGTAKIRFAVADIVRDPLPPADLLIVKDVLQHLPDADIMRFFLQLAHYRHVLIINDVDPQTLTAEHSDIPPGGFRAIDLTRPPYRMPATKALVWHHDGHAKMILHFRRDDVPAGREQRRTQRQSPPSWRP
jgi:SAM-dependent methyltransferase